MSTEQLAIVAPLVTAVLLAGVSAWNQLKVTQATLDSQGQVTKDTLESQRTLAVQDRIATMYEDLLEMVGHTMETVNATKPFAYFGKPPEPPLPVDQERIRRIQARVGVHGSPEAKEILERWSRGCSQFYNDVWYLDTIQNEEQNRPGVKPSDIKASYGVTKQEQWQRVEAQRAALHKVVRELEDAVNSEMRA